MAAYQLRNHQNDFKNFFFNNGYIGATAWHGMGLGKTLTTLDCIHTHLSYLKGQGVRLPKALVLMPKSAHATWQTEAQKWTPYLYRDLLLLPISQMHNALALAKYHDIRAIAIDESHGIKNPDTNRAQNLKELLLNIHNGPNGGFKNGRLLLLSGTPMLNGAHEWYTSWALCASRNLEESASRLKDMKRYEQWKKTFSQKKENKWKEYSKRAGREVTKTGASYTGVAEQGKLTELLSPIVHYRRVEDCVDLPAKQEISIDLNLPDDKLLKDANIEEPEHYMAVLERLARAKTPYFIDWIRDFLSVNTGKQLVCFSNYKFPLEEAYEKFKNISVMITGDQTGGERKANEKAFQLGKKRLVFMTYKAGSEALNFQNSHYTIYHGYPWTDGAVKQAMARTYRSGQLEKSFHYFLTSGYNDKRILLKVREKEEATNEVEENLLAAQGIILPPKLTLDTFI